MANRNVSFYGSMNKALGGDPIQRDYAQDPRRLMAQQLMRQGSSTAPVQSPLEGLTRALTSVAGGYFGGQAQRDMQEREQAKGDAMAQALAGGVQQVLPSNEDVTFGSEHSNMLNAQTAGMFNESDMSGVETQNMMPGIYQSTNEEYTGKPFTNEAFSQYDTESSVKDAFGLERVGGGIQGVIDAGLATGNKDIQPFLQNAQLMQMQQTAAAKQAELARTQKREDLEYELKLKQKFPSPVTGRPTSTIQDSRELTALQNNLANAKTPAGKLDAQRKLDNFIQIKASDLEYIRKREEAKIQPKIKAAPLIAGGTASGAQAVKASGEAFESLAKIGQSIANIDDAIAAINSGANTGPVYAMLPSVRESSIALDNVQRRMGLDVIGSVTFGALSKGELDLALATAIPTKMKPVALRKWLLTKRSAQQKLSDYLSKAAIYLGTPGNNVKSWVELQKKNVAQGGTPKRIILDDQGNIIP